eukprot:TRINITY_DN28951_c0_g1_i1.p1 TRINITY_DN28951_c0_g1~~TRINITY_DN28951_c0_g1_i1.p1  ORF type:complete len:174 (-),score=13.27 TRINITY_DN28951_c0_g1_i1:657-1178(-)
MTQPMCGRKSCALLGMHAGGFLAWALTISMMKLEFVAADHKNEFSLDWESGFPDGSLHLDPAIEPSFSLNRKSTVSGCSNSGNEITKCKCGVGGYSPKNCDTYYGISSLHSQSLEKVNWPRKGNGVLIFYADGRELGLNNYVPSGKYASKRCELGSIGYTYHEGDDVYYTASF